MVQIYGQEKFREYLATTSRQGNPFPCPNLAVLFEEVSFRDNIIAPEDYDEASLICRASTTCIPYTTLNHECKINGFIKKNTNGKIEVECERGHFLESRITKVLPVAVSKKIKFSQRGTLISAGIGIQIYGQKKFREYLAQISQKDNPFSCPYLVLLPDDVSFEDDKIFKRHYLKGHFLCKESSGGNPSATLSHRCQIEGYPIEISNKKIKVKCKMGGWLELKVINVDVPGKWNGK